MGGYLDWNDRIVRHFFRPDLAGRSVHLYVNDDVLKGLALTGQGITDFIAAVKLGPAFAYRGGICERALQTFNRWRERPELELPPYVGYLALFVLAAGTEGDFAKHAYYPRLRALLGLPADGQPPGFDEMLTLWDDLERWSVSDRRGELGVFTVTRSGKWVHVGVPLGQTVLTEHERHGLPEVFSRAGLDPASPISDDALATAIRKNGSGVLNVKTVQRLAKQREEDMFPVLLDAIAQELSEWDGHVSSAKDKGDAGATFVPIRLCVHLDVVSGRALCSLRCRTSEPLPEPSLAVFADSGVELAIGDELPGWSAPLQTQRGDQLDAAGLNWSAGLSASSEDGQWVVRWPGAEVRLLASGQTEGLPGLVETYTIGAGKGLFLLFYETAWPTLKPWASRSCDGFREIAVLVGLPTGWRLATADAIRPDRALTSRYPVLAGAESVRIQFVGGVRSGTGASYFSFALPRIAAMGLESGDRLLVGGIAAGQDGASGLFNIPEASVHDDHLVVEVRRGQDAVRSQSLWVVRDFDWRAAARFAPRVDRRGLIADSPVPGVSGADVEGVDAETVVGALDPLLIPALDGVMRLYLLGRRVGEVTTWPTERTPEWLPIWAVVPGEHPRFVYCAPPGAEIEPIASTNGVRPKQRRLWKELVWYRRKQTPPPKHAGVRRLLSSYRKVARFA